MLLLEKMGTRLLTNIDLVRVDKDSTHLSCCACPNHPKTSHAFVNRSYFLSDTLQFLPRCLMKDEDGLVKLYFDSSSDWKIKSDEFLITYSIIRLTATIICLSFSTRSFLFHITLSSKFRFAFEFVFDLLASLQTTRRRKGKKEK